MINIKSINIDIITLVGMMGSGKTNCGKILAKKLNFMFFDIDNIIETEENLLINEIFETYGEKYFRSIEEKTIFESVDKCLKQNIRAIISLGGGGFESKKTRNFLLKNSRVIWLDASVDVLIDRVGKAKNRPMIQGEINNTIKKLLDERIKNYQQSHLKINTNHSSFDAICDKIIIGIS